MQRLLAEPLFFIFFAYGASFLLLGFLVARGTAGAREIPLIRAFDMLALFGIVHGITELTDWARFIRKTLGAPELPVLVWLSQVCLVLSFLVLLQFALNLLTAQSTSRVAPSLRLVPAAAAIGFVAYVGLTGTSDVLAAGLLGRHLFGFASAALAAAALVTTTRAIRLLGDDTLVRNLYVAAAAFVAYAVFGGVITAPIAGIPVQFFRAICAVTIALSAFSMVRLSRTVAGTPADLAAAKA